MERTGTAYGVTPHTIDGADRVRVYVPADSYYLYRDGQGCETNPWETFPDRVYTY